MANQGMTPEQEKLWRRTGSVTGERYRDPRRAYRIVDQFEQELCDYTGAPYAVAVNSCTNAIFLALTYEQMKTGEHHVTLPKHTYIGVLQAALNAGYSVEWHDNGWIGGYSLMPTHVVDCARALWPSMYVTRELTCLSFHAAKQLPLGRGGAILTDDPDAAEWLRAARMDGRPPGQPIEATIFPGYHCPMPPDVAARGLDVLSRWNDTGYTPPPLPPETYPDLSLL